MFLNIILLVFISMTHADSSEELKSSAAELLKNSQGSVASLINEINSMDSEWEAGYNELAELDTEELKLLMGFKQKPLEDFTDILNFDIEVPRKIPKNFDSRKQWPGCDSIGSIKDQANCGSCWAVSSASAASDRLCIASNYSIRLNLSAEALLTCCVACTGGDPGCEGGYLSETWKYIKWHGLVTGGDYGSREGCQPYSIKPCISCSEEAQAPKCTKNKCSNKGYRTPYKKDIHKNKNYYQVPKNVTLIQADILQNGPLIAGFTVFRDFMSYKKGVYKHKKGQALGNHAVRIIGWGQQKQGRKMLPYWLVANSWNRTWGDNGLFKILRGSNECNIESNVFAGQSIPR